MPPLGEEKRKQTLIRTGLVQNESAHDKTYNKTCATSQDSDQPAHPAQADQSLR